MRSATSVSSMPRMPPSCSWFHSSVSWPSVPPSMEPGSSASTEPSARGRLGGESLGRSGVEPLGAQVHEISLSPGKSGDFSRSDRVAWQLIRFFLTLCGSSAVSGKIANGRACERNQNGRPAQGSKFWASSSLMMTVGLFPLPDQRSAFAPIADGEAEIGMGGPAAAFRTFRSRVRL